MSVQQAGAICRWIGHDSAGDIMQDFFEALRIQRHDDHRYYHHSRINQSLHLLSALCFMTAYALLFVSPATAALLGWLVSMVARQSGHFFFEPRGYDHYNQATDEHKEAIKVGYNIRRKIVLLVIWGLSPLVLAADPTLLGLTHEATGRAEFMQQVGWIWLAVGIGGLLFRTVQLFFVRDVQTGLVWFTKIVTDPFNDAVLYYKAPLYLLRGEWVDPMPAERLDEEQRA
jgi:hypothetical protein